VDGVTVINVVALDTDAVYEVVAELKVVERVPEESAKSNKFALYGITTPPPRLVTPSP
jgi:hypothetical protein